MINFPISIPFLGFPSNKSHVGEMSSSAMAASWSVGCSSCGCNEQGGRGNLLPLPFCVRDPSNQKNYPPNPLLVSALFTFLSYSAAVFSFPLRPARVTASPEGRATAPPLARLQEPLSAAPDNPRLGPRKWYATQLSDSLSSFRSTHGNLALRCFLDPIPPYGSSIPRARIRSVRLPSLLGDLIFSSS